MNDIVAATSQGSPAINGNAAQGNGGGTPADGLFGLLMANELTGQETPAPGETKPFGKQDEASDAALLSALMQYGNLLGILPLQPEAAAQPAGNASENAAQAAPAAPEPTQRRFAAGGQAGLMGLMAARLLVNSGAAAQATRTETQSTAQAAAGAEQTVDGAPQAAQDFISLLEGLARRSNAPATAPAQTGGQPAAAAQNSLEALQQIKELFVSLIEAGQEAEAAPQADAAAQSAPPARPGDAAAPAPQASVLPDTASPLPAAGAIRTGAQADTAGGKQQNDSSFLELPAQADGSPAKAGAAGGKKEPAGFDAALRAQHYAQAQGAPAAGLPEGNAAPAHAKLTPGEAFDSIVDKITSMQNSTRKEMEISLKPDSLGHVVIKLTMRDGELVAKIAASNPKVQDAFASQAASLQSSLAEQGLKDVRVVVTGTAVPDASLQQQAANGGQARKEQEKRRNAVIVEAAAGPPGASRPLLAYEQITSRPGAVNCLA